MSRNLDLELEKPTRPPKLGAHDIEQMLRTRHAEDIFVAQCKTGQSGEGVQIFDGWAMKPSWANPLVIGYEIKVSRGDYLRDNKWRGYLPFCNEFYFVVPANLVASSEIPEGAGLLYAAHGRLLMKLRAKYHEATSLESLYKYILMYHAKIASPRIYGNDSREERITQWKQRLEKAKALSDLGYSLSRQLQTRVQTEITAVKNQNENLKSENQLLADVKTAIERLGYTLATVPRWDPGRAINERLEEIQAGISREFRGRLEAVAQSISRLQEVLGK